MCSHPNVCHACDAFLRPGQTKMQHNRERHGGPRWGKPHIIGPRATIGGKS